MAYIDHEEEGHNNRAENVEIFSPRPTKPITFDFPDAMREIIAGKTITKLEWDDPSIHCALNNNHLQIFHDGKWWDWIVSDGDLAGEDYLSVEPLAM